MATAAAVAAAAATAVSAGVGAANAAGAFGSGQPGAPKFQQAPRPGYESAEQKYYGRVLAANINNKGPSWNDWLKSGGQATYQLQDTGMTPTEAQHMGFVDKGGQAVNYYYPPGTAPPGAPGQEPGPTGPGSLNDEQWMSRLREAGPQNPLHQRYQRIQNLDKRISNLQGKVDAGDLPDARQQRIQGRITHLTNRRSTIFNKGRGGPAA